MTVELCYIDGLVSTGNQIPYTILEIIFPNKKIFSINFINILFCPVDKEASFYFIANPGHNKSFLKKNNLLVCEKYLSHESIDSTGIAEGMIISDSRNNLYAQSFILAFQFYYKPFSTIFLLKKS